MAHEDSYTGSRRGTDTLTLRSGPIRFSTPSRFLRLEPDRPKREVYTRSLGNGCETKGMVSR